MISRYNDYRQGVEGELRDIFRGREGFLYNLLRYHLGWVDQQGRAQDGETPLHLQGAVVLAACEALGADFRAGLPAAAGIELVHHFTLVHGEVQAGRAEDPGRPSIWWVWGPAQAINAGDGLHALGRTAMMRLARNGAPPERVFRAVWSLDTACLRLCEGQYMDLEFQDQLMVTNAAYLEMVNRKSGALTGCAAESGALAAGASDAQCDALQRMGVSLGTAWQIARDIAQLWGEHGDGVTPGNIISKKKSLPLIHALEHGSIAARRELGAIYMKRALEPEDANRLVAILDETGSRPAAEDQARQLLDEGLSAASSAGLASDGMALLREIGDWALQGK